MADDRKAGQVGLQHNGLEDPVFSPASACLAHGHERRTPGHHRGLAPSDQHTQSDQGAGRADPANGSAKGSGGVTHHASAATLGPPTGRDSGTALTGPLRRLRTGAWLAAALRGLKRPDDAQEPPRTGRENVVGCAEPVRRL